MANRPIDFLLSRGGISLPESHETVCDSVEIGQTEKVTRKMPDSITAINQHLWRTFYEGYFALHRESQFRTRAHSKESPQVGQAAIIFTDLVQQQKWPLGLMVEVIQSSDKKIRSVRVKTQKSIREKAVSHLISREVPDDKELGQGFSIRDQPK